MFFLWNAVGCTVSFGLLLDWFSIESILYLIFWILLDISIFSYFGNGHVFSMECRWLYRFFWIVT